MTPRPAERRLQELGIKDPEDIDVDAIAFDMGALVKYVAQSGCEASITGFNDKAIIKVNPDCEPGRQRFSAAHECGHWEHHRGRQFRCRSDDIEQVSNKSVTDPERVANEYAADLLMPQYLFKPAAATISYTNVESIRHLKELFRTSFLATAIRMVKMGPEPIILICHSPSGISWFDRSNSIPRYWWPMKQLDSDTYAYDLMRGDLRNEKKRSKMPADLWFDFKSVGRHEVFEESITYAGNVLTLITGIDDEA